MDACNDIALRFRTQTLGEYRIGANGPILDIGPIGTQYSKCDHWVALGIFSAKIIDLIKVLLKTQEFVKRLSKAQVLIRLFYDTIGRDKENNVLLYLIYLL